MKKALVIRLSSLGDVALSSVLFEPLFRAGYRTYLLTYSPYRELFEDDPRVCVIDTDKKSLLSDGNLDRIRGLGIDVYIDIHRNIKSFLLRRKLKGRWVLYRKEALRRRLSVYLKFLRREYHITEAYSETLRELGIEVKDKRPKILVSEDRLRSMKEIVGEETFLTLGVGARYRKKAYPHFGKLVEILTDRGYRIVYVGDYRDRELVKDFPGLNLCGELSLTDVLAVIRLSKVFIGNDSGLLHCARAVRTPALQIYGGTHPTLGFSLYPEEGRVVIKGMECQPCDIHGKGKCKYGDYRCLDIEPGYIASLIEDMAGRQA
jgi:ADP-heptose:LPS heptosyltransferase